MIVRNVPNKKWLSWVFFVYRAVFVNDDTVTQKHIPHYWSFVKGIHPWPSDYPQKELGIVFCTFYGLIMLAWTSCWKKSRVTFLFGDAMISL